jgi:phosphoglycolate phosphatase-like HAD superfamily hydrolase
MRLILFDIDGTILLTDGAGRRAIHRALLEETGTAGPIDSYRFDGKTDPQIVRELLTHAGHPDAGVAERVSAVCDRYVGLLEAELGRPAHQTRLMAGITDLLAALIPYETDKRAVVGLLTGNLERGAALKLHSAGIAPTRFALGAYGSDAAHRPDLPDIARRRAEHLLGTQIAGADVVIIGDTPDDVACARPIGARTIGVATGYFDVAALRAAGASWVFADLSDTRAVLEALIS